MYHAVTVLIKNKYVIYNKQFLYIVVNTYHIKV
jgi:hypothetical protein